MDSLDRVRGIQRATLHVVLSRCPPSPSHGDYDCPGAFSSEAVERLIAFDACDVEVTVSVLPSKMLLGPLTKRLSFKVNFWDGVRA